MFTDSHRLSDIPTYVHGFEKFKLISGPQFLLVVLDPMYLTLPAFIHLPPPTKSLPYDINELGS